MDFHDEVRDFTVEDFDQARDRLCGGPKVSIVRISYRWANGMVMTFGHDGEQIPDLQGPWSDELEQAIRARAPHAELVGFPPDEPAVWPV